MEISDFHQNKIKILKNIKQCKTSECQPITAVKKTAVLMQINKLQITSDLYDTGLRGGIDCTRVP